MKAILLLALVASAFCAEDRSYMTNLIQMQAKAADAIDSGLQMLKDLKQANVDAQDKADEVNRTQEKELGEQIAELYAIAELNKQNGDECDAWKNQLNEDINTTRDNLIWIRNRRQDLQRKRVELSEQRCVANGMFIKTLKEHDEALAVIKLLREDIVGIVKEHTGQDVGFAQVKTSVQRLSAYTHLFNEEAMKAFNQLAQAQDVPDEWTEDDARAHDNDRGALELQEAEHNAAERSVATRFVDMIDKLEQHMVDSMRNLEENEIQAAMDLATWLAESEVEFDVLDRDEHALDIKQDKLAITIVAATAKCERLWTIYFESSATYHAAVEARERVRRHYMAEKARRDD